MFSPHLFTHKYDIDDIIAALCGKAPCWLDTATGAILASPPAGGRVFPLQPLPPSFLEELAASPELRHLSEPDQTALRGLLAGAAVAGLPGYFGQGRAGGWLRERVKDAALEWLDTHDLIPPSMRHINRARAARLYASGRVAIVEGAAAEGEDPPPR